ncbi:hypothetical protein F1880_000663 [Penicillium rolfsii]|nr:hypothetical protein F1880_000663 [Penicillium rolfsii]
MPSSKGHQPKKGTPADESRGSPRSKAIFRQNSERKYEQERSSINDLLKLKIMQMGPKDRKKILQDIDDHHFLFTGNKGSVHKIRSVEIPVLLMLNGDGKLMITPQALYRSGYKDEPLLDFETKTSNPVHDPACPEEIRGFFWDWWTMWSSLIKFYHPNLDIDSRRLLNPFTTEFADLCTDDTTKTYPLTIVKQLEKCQTVAIPPAGSSAKSFKDNFLRVVNIHRAAKGRGKVLWDGKAFVEESSVAAQQRGSKRSLEEQVASQDPSKKRATGRSIFRMLQEIDDAGEWEEFERFLAENSSSSRKNKTSLDESRRIDVKDETSSDDEHNCLHPIDNIETFDRDDVEQFRNNSPRNSDAGDEDKGSPPDDTELFSQPPDRPDRGNSEGEIQVPAVVEINDSVERIDRHGESNPAQFQGLRQELTKKIENLQGEVENLNENMKSLRMEIQQNNRLLHQLLCGFDSVFRVPPSHLPTS